MATKQKKLKVQAQHVYLGDYQHLITAYVDGEPYEVVAYFIGKPLTAQTNNRLVQYINNPTRQNLIKYESLVNRISWQNKKRELQFVAKVMRTLEVYARAVYRYQVLGDDDAIDKVNDYTIKINALLARGY